MTSSEKRVEDSTESLAGGAVQKASDLMVKCLEAEGIEYIFGVPGEGKRRFYDVAGRQRQH